MIPIDNGTTENSTPAQTALVTGGASGIGRSTVRLFLTRGWSVVAADLNESSGRALLDEHPNEVAAGRLAFARADVSSEEDVERAAAQAASLTGHLACVVNNAGIGGAFGRITETSVEDWDYTFAVLSRGVFLGVKHAAKIMQAQGTGGAIVNVASLAALTGDAGPQAYSAAKASVVHMSRVFATELGPHRIRVNCVCPGAIATPLNPSASRGFDGSELARAQPLPFVGEPEHLASAIYFLGSSESSFVTGQYLAVDGGLEAAGPRLGQYLGTDPRYGSLVGVNRGNTGVKSTVHGKATQ
ncbi:SDR family oxidoreductase [Nocardia sp. NBC_00565]|uniref:SDR family NAD(P)-dependent oxidoreductase n=1 Tax=Nocardia sp. NBC_00565 TaxID=2975993 RepID=UPI002E806028|nr:SDR family oxidoreductase [Nocardia sp. NBC_00565]WUC06765.1 SDR family oxidoreductase [Nocardia sp. NBC_00565]